MNGIRRNELSVISSTDHPRRLFHWMYDDIKSRYIRLRQIMVDDLPVEWIKLKQSSYSGSWNPYVMAAWQVTYQELYDNMRLLSPPPVRARLTPLMFIRQMMASEVIRYNPRYPGKSKAIRDLFDTTKEQVLGSLRVPAASFATF